MIQQPVYLASRLGISDAEIAASRKALLGLSCDLLELLRQARLPTVLDEELLPRVMVIVEACNDERIQRATNALRPRLESIHDTLSSLARDIRARKGTPDFLLEVASAVDDLGAALTTIHEGAGAPIILDSVVAIVRELEAAKREVDRSEFVFNVAQFFKIATQHFGNQKTAEEWLVTGCPHLDGAMPISLLGNWEGVDQVTGLLAKIGSSAESK